MKIEDEKLLEILKSVHKSCYPQLEEALTKITDGLVSLQIITGLNYQLTLKESWPTQEEIDKIVALDPDGIVNKKSRC